MNSVGIDVSNGRSTVAVFRPFGEEVFAPFEVRHDAVSLSVLARELNSLDGEVRVVMEHTGRYYECESRVEIATKESSGNSTEDMNKQARGRTDLGSGLDIGAGIKPVEKALNLLA